MPFQPPDRTKSADENCSNHERILRAKALYHIKRILGNRFKNRQRKAMPGTSLQAISRQGVAVAHWKRARMREVSSSKPLERSLPDGRRSEAADR
jgi:hypothetical protein